MNYADFVDLAKLKTSDPLFAVRPGMVLEYWLTAEDACDYPKPNVGESKHYRVQIVEPINNDKVKKDEQAKADHDKQANDQKQDAQDQKEDAERQKQNEATEKKDGESGKGKQQEGDKSGKSKRGPTIRMANRTRPTRADRESSDHSKPSKSRERQVR